MSRFLFRNQGGDPRRVTGRFKTPNGKIINNLNNLSNAELRKLDVFRLEKIIPTVEHRFQRVTFDNYAYDLATATATENYKVIDMTKEEAFQNALGEIKNLRLSATQAGFKWEGDKVDENDEPLLLEKRGAVSCGQTAKLNLMMLLEQFRGGAITSYRWELSPEIYIPLESLDDANTLLQQGVVYESNQDKREREAVKELKAMLKDNSVKVADMAAKLEDYVVAFENDPMRYVEPEN